MICRDIIGCCPRDYRRGSDVPDSVVSRYDGAHTLGLEGGGEGSDDAGKAWRTRVEERRGRWKEGDGAMVEGGGGEGGGRKGIIYYAVSMSLTMTASSILVTRRLSWRPISADHR